MRKKLLLGNWKMNKTVAEAKEFALASREIALYAAEHDILVGVAPTYLSLAAMKENSRGFIVAAQNCHFETSGAFTGEVSIPMLKELGIDWVIVGHSERRMYDNETSEKCCKKIHALLENDMIPVYCVGETLSEFEAGKTKEVVERQIRKGLADLCPKCVRKVVIAYEPVWSIGTGKNASTEIAEDVCAFIRGIVREMYAGADEEIMILYGGSVKPENVKGYLRQEDVDGALVGGASLKIDSFTAMVKNLAE